MLKSDLEKLVKRYERAIRKTTMRTAADLDIKWTWRDEPPSHLKGFKAALIRAWFEKFGSVCEDCGNEMYYGSCYVGPKRYATLDHILARGLGGKELLSNYRVICSDCNWRKSGKESEEARRRFAGIPYAERMRIVSAQKCESESG